MNSTTTIRGLSCIALLVSVWSATAQNSPEEMKVLRNWSLFSEYYRNGDYQSAVPFGWIVQRMAPARFKTLYHKLAESYIKLYEQAEGQLKEAYADTIVLVYDLGIQHVPDRAPRLYRRKGLAMENYHVGKELEAIQAYAKGIELDFAGTEFFYIDRLGVLYSKNQASDNDFKARAIDLYRRYLEREPDNQIALERLRRLIEDPKELIEIALQKLKTDPEKTAYIWEVVKAYQGAEEYCAAIPYLVKLTKKSPDSENYWAELGKTYQHCAAGLGKSDERRARYRDAIKAYQRALRINPDVKETILSIALSYRELRNFSTARTYARRAAAKDRSWGLPYLEIAQIYEAQVQQCVLSVRGGWENLKFEDKVVYRLAQEYYRKATSIDTKISVEARTRARHLESLVPTQEDYFFNKGQIKDGKIAVTGQCYDWIAETITVPRKFQ
ncbi:MAG: hypothetical protein ACE5H0_02090 [Bacteroidota bacterium]